MISVLAIVAIVVVAVAFWGFVLRETGIVPRQSDYDGVIDGWWGQPITEEEMD